MARDFPGDEDEGSSSREEANGVGTQSPRRDGYPIVGAVKASAFLASPPKGVYPPN